MTETTEKPKSHDYNNIYFVERKPYSRTTLKVHHITTKSEYNHVVTEIKARHNYLWYGQITDGKVSSPLLVDFETVPDVAYSVQEEQKNNPDPLKWGGGLSCPFCACSVSSTAGRTLHVKAHHNDRLAEYTSLLVSKNTPKKLDVVDDYAENEDVVDRISELKCPICNKLCSSSSGLTLHLKKHATNERTDIDV